MRLKDITIGGRYQARVSGAITTVRVLDLRETSTFGGRCRTTIVAVNDGPGASSRSARRSVCGRCRTSYVSAISKRSTTCNRASGRFPSRIVRYDLRPIAGTLMELAVEYVTRVGDELVAHASDGSEYPVSGKGAYVLSPRRKT